MNGRRLPVVLGRVLAVALATLPVTLVAALLVIQHISYDSPDPAESRSLFEARGRDVADAWRAIPPETRHRGFAPLQELTLQPAGGVPEVLANLVHFGNYRLRVELPTQRPDTGQVRFSNGEWLDVPLVGADQAFHDLSRHGCSDAPYLAPGQPPPSNGACVNLAVTAVQLGEVPLQTSRGLATVPAWLFSVSGLTGPVARVAVAPEAIVPPPKPDLPPANDRLYQVVRGPMFVERVDGATVHFWTDPNCTEPVGAVAHETAEVVVIGLRVREVPGMVCAAVTLPRPFRVTLASPVGSRPVLGPDGTMVPYLVPGQLRQYGLPG